MARADRRDVETELEVPIAARPARSRTGAMLTAIPTGGSPAGGSSPVFVGRAAELERLRRGLADVPFAVIVGLAGVGKSALAQRFADGWRGPVARHHVSVGMAVTSLLDDLRRGLALPGEPTVEMRTDLERVTALAARMDRGAALAIIEDADRLPDVAWLAALDVLASLLRRGRVIATCRARLHERAGGPERVEVILDGLDAGAAAELWARLDDLHGARGGFEEAWQRTRGNPFHLRRAHAGDLDGDPASPTVAALEPAERRLALALALVGMPLPRELAVELVAGDPLAAGPLAAERAIRGLAARLVVDTTARGELVVHDLLGGRLIAAASREETIAAHRAIGSLDGAGLGLIAGTRLRVRHLAAAGMARPARDLLLARAAELVRSGGAGELLRGLDLVTSEADAEARLARARAMARMLDFGRALDEVMALGPDRDGAGDSLRATFAHLALLTLGLDVAGRVSRAGLASPTAPPELRVRFAVVHLLTSTYRGDGDAARAAIDRAAAGLASPLMRGYAGFARAFSLWLEERDGEAEQAMRAAWPLFRDRLGFRASVLAPAFMVTVLARVGKIADAAAALAEAERSLARFNDPLMTLSLRAMRATLLESQGDFAAARDEAAAAEDGFAGAGHRIGALWSRLVRARASLACGQLRAGRRLLDQVTREAAAAGAALMVRLAARAGRADPWVALTGPPPPDSSRPGEARRDRVLAVLRSLGAGQVAVARGYLAALDRAAVDPLEAALLAVADRALDLGDPAGADRAGTDDPRVHRACEAAARAGADPELVPTIAAWLDQRAAARAAGQVRRVVVDRRADEIRVGDLTIDLARRPALRRLFYALLEAPGRGHDRTALARAIWAIDYRPSVHDGALWVNVKRLRALVARAGLQIVSHDDGVGLRVEPGCELQTTGP